MTLIDRLLKLSALWAAASNRSTARLATIVANDGKILDRLEGGATCTVATYERFLGYFRDAANWPGDAIPAEAQELLGEMEAIALPVRASPGKADEVSGRVAICAVCDLRAEDPAVLSCTEVDCGLAVKAVA